jgi:hypothetical protein
MNSEPTDIDLSLLRKLVEKDIETYHYIWTDKAIGNPWTEAAIQSGLAQFRASLIEPYWTEVEIRDTFEQVGMMEGPRRKCAAVADDGTGILLLFDPVEDSFVLAERGSTGLTTFGVRGDAVGCFLAR